ncbi:MAG: heparinase II/III family protein [Cohnella sp.]|nr:heparinase II/III family protein [Cohnella sp.]
MRSASVIVGETDKWVVVPYASGAIAADGTRNDGAWEGAAALTHFAAIGDHAALPNGPQVWVMFDRHQLYLRVRSYAAAGEKPAQQRGFHVLLRAASAPGYTVELPVIVEDGGIGIDPYWGPGVVSAVCGDVHTWRETRNEGQDTVARWTTELAVPLTLVGQEKIVPGEEWQINVLAYRIIDRHPIIETWVPVLRSFARHWAGDAQSPDTYHLRADITQEGRMGRLFFGTLPTLPSTSCFGGKTLMPWHPEDVLLEYVGFTAKSVSVPAPACGFAVDRLILAWIAPSGGRTQLDNVRFSLEENRVVAAYMHPEPLERGVYGLEIVLGEQAGGMALWTAASFDGQQIIAAGMRSPSHRVNMPPAGKRHVPFAPASAEITTLLGLIPERAGLFYVGDPAHPMLAPRNLYDWSVDRPHVVVSRVSGLAYPNDDYAETEVFAVNDRNGSKVEYPYYEDARGRRFFLSAHVWYRQREYVLGRLSGVALSDPLGGARLLYRLAQVYAGYVPTNDYPWIQYPLDANVSVPPTYWGGFWSFWYYLDLYVLEGLLNAFRTVKRTDAFEQLSAEAGTDVERVIAEDMLKPTVDYLRAFGIVNGNMDYALWVGYIDLAQAIDEPDYVHDAVMLLDEYVNGTYLADGFFQEVTVSYHVQSTEGVKQAAERLIGYVDPPGYVSPRSGVRLDRPEMAKKYPLLAQAERIPRQLTFPDGRVFPVNDTWAFARYEPLDVGALLLPAAGIARLSHEEHGAQLYMTFSPKYGHHHYDPLSLTLFAAGQELLPDLGYTHTFHYYPAISALGHNTVIVDAKDMDTGDAGKEGGCLEMFVRLGDGLQVMRAREENAYPGVKQYARESWLIGLPDGAGNGVYVVDVFRVAGGNRHEYTLQGDANHDATFRTELPLAEYGANLLPAGIEAVEAVTELETGSAEGHYPGYIYFKQVKRAEIANGCYETDLVTEDSEGRPQARMRLKGFTGFTGAGRSELFLGRFPSIRMTRLHDRTRDTNAEAARYTMPKLVVRREGAALRSTFVTVMEPYADVSGPAIGETRILNDDYAESGDVALEIRHGDYTDIILRTNDAQKPFTIGDVALHGKVGFIRKHNDVVRQMALVGGTLLRIGSDEIRGEGSVSGTIVGVRRIADGAAENAFVTDTEVSQAMIGRYMIVIHPDNMTHGYKIKAIETVNRRSTIVLDGSDPGFRLAADGSSRMTAFPFKTWSGAHHFYVDPICLAYGGGHS